MNLQEAVAKAGQILDEERIFPTVHYEMVAPGPAGDFVALYSVATALSERGRHPRTVQEHAEHFIFKSTNFDLLCALLDQVPEQDRAAFFAASLSRTSNRGAYRHTVGGVLYAGEWRRCSSEMPLVAEFVVRRGDKRLLISALSKAALSPGLTLLLLQLEEMIALNFTLFTDEEYTQLRTAVESVKGTVPDFRTQARPGSSVESNTIHNVCREVPILCDSISEGCRKATFLYLKGSLLPGMNLEINQDKGTVRTFLQKLGFTELLIQSLDEAERLYRAASSPFDLKNSLGHLRNFLEQLHIQACAAAKKSLGGDFALLRMPE